MEWQEASAASCKHAYRWSKESAFCRQNQLPEQFSSQTMDTGHFIPFHADSLGNIPYNIVCKSLCEGTQQTGGDIEREREGESEQKAYALAEHELIFNRFSRINECGTWWEDHHSWFLFIYLFLSVLQLKHVLERQFTTGSCIVIPGSGSWLRFTRLYCWNATLNLASLSFITFIRPLPPFLYSATGDCCLCFDWLVILPV